LAAAPSLDAPVRRLLVRRDDAARFSAILLDLPYFHRYAVEVIRYVTGLPARASSWGAAIHEGGAVALLGSLLAIARRERDDLLGARSRPIASRSAVRWIPSAGMQSHSTRPAAAVRDRFVVVERHLLNQRRGRARPGTDLPRPRPHQAFGTFHRGTMAESTTTVTTPRRRLHGHDSRSVARNPGSSHRRPRVCTAPRANDREQVSSASKSTTRQRCAHK